MRRYHLFFLLILISPAVKAQVQIYSRHDADSLLITLKQPLPDSGRANTLLNISDFLVHQRRVSKSQQDSVRAQITEIGQLNNTLHSSNIQYRQAIVLALLQKVSGETQAGKQTLIDLIAVLKQKGDLHLLGRAYYELSDFYSGDFLQQTMSTRISYLKESIKAYQKIPDRLSLGRCYRFLADLHMMSDSLGGAFVEANMALTYYHAAGYKDIQGILALLGRLYFTQEKYKEAINYQLMALTAAKKSRQDNVRLICQINNSLGLVFLRLNDFPNALHYYNEALAIAEQEKDSFTIYMLAANMVDTYLKAGQGQQAETFFRQINQQFPVPQRKISEAGDCGVSKTFLKIYITLGQLDKARLYYHRVVEETKNPHINLTALSEHYEILARANISTNNFKQAKLYLDKNEKLLLKIKDYHDLTANYRLKAAIDTAHGDYRTGMRYILAAQKIEDSLLNSTKLRQIDQLQGAYVAREKESQISLLQQKSRAEKASVQKANLIRDFSVGGAFSLLLIALLLYRQNRQKQKHNQLIEQKNQVLGDLVAEKEWLLKEVHHRVKNNLHTVICLLESQASFLENEALQAVESSRCRIYAMSLIHQKFYQSDNVRSIEMKTYISELLTYLAESFGYPRNVRTSIDVPEVNLSISKAIPVGLIINEAVNNAYKYAFPKQRDGKIAISLSISGTIAQLEIRDNGVGIPFDPTDDIADSLGIELMKGLTRDLKGNITFLQGIGTGIIVTFQFDPVPLGLEEVLYA